MHICSETSNAATPMQTQSNDSRCLHKPAALVTSRENLDMTMVFITALLLLNSHGWNITLTPSRLSLSLCLSLLAL